jgi:hypothetical protein
MQRSGIPISEVLAPEHQYEYLTKLCTVSVSTLMGVQCARYTHASKHYLMYYMLHYSIRGVCVP